MLVLAFISCSWSLRCEIISFLCCISVSFCFFTPCSCFCSSFTHFLPSSSFWMVLCREDLCCLQPCTVLIKAWKLQFCTSSVIVSPITHSRKVLSSWVFTRLSEVRGFCLRVRPNT